MIYELIKEYPGSPKLGSTVIKCAQEAYYFNGQRFLIDLIENNPEYWKRIDYKVLNITYECLPDTHKTYISKVLRTSDNVEFKIGDQTSYGKISKFYECSDELRALFEGKNYSQGLEGLEGLEGLVKIEDNKLFTTEDGVDVYEKDKIFILNRSTFTIYPKTLAEEIDLPESTKYLFFSTKEKAEEYVVLSKPCLCVNDVENMIDFSNYLILRELVKSKLK